MPKYVSVCVHIWANHQVSVVTKLMSLCVLLALTMPRSNAYKISKTNEKRRRGESEEIKRKKRTSEVEVC